MNKIVAVGGTGQLVLHYYLQLYLLGVVRQPFDAVVIDTDDFIQSLKAWKNFLGELQYGQNASEALGVVVPVIRGLRVSPQRHNTVADALSGNQGYVISDTPPYHPMQAFFNRDTLGQNLSKGLYARPALSSVISQEKLQSNFLRPASNSALIIVGSVLGGTGGGLMAPIISQIQFLIKSQGINSVNLRAVLFGEYFDPDEKESRIDRLRVKSNQSLSLRALREALEDVHSFHIVGGPDTPPTKRDADQEKKGEHLPWPQEVADPVWRGVQALEHLLSESIRPRLDAFEEREVEEFKDPIRIGFAHTTLKQRMQTVESLIKKRVVLLMTQDPWASAIWGVRFTRFLEHFWTIAAQREGEKERVADFPVRVQNAMEMLWRGKEDHLGLSKIFPLLTESHSVRPNNLSKIGWPEVSGKLQRNENLFGGVDEIARRAAANILFRVLREGV
jgi:hypothetical protein